MAQSLKPTKVHSWSFPQSEWEPVERRRWGYNSRRALSDPRGREIMELGLRSSQGARWSRNMAWVTSSPAIPPCPGFEVRCRRNWHFGPPASWFSFVNSGFMLNAFTININGNCANALVHPMLVPRAWEICHYITQITNPLQFFFWHEISQRSPRTLLGHPIPSAPVRPPE